MTTRSTPDRYLCIAVDLKGYGGHDLWGQHDLQSWLRALLDAAADDARLDRGTWRTQQQGDAELALVPAGPDEPRLIGEFVRHLDARLSRLNEPRREQARVRLRVAFHSGWAEPAAMGFAGEAVVAVSRLVESESLKTALANSGPANLGVIVSAGVYEMVSQGLTTLPRQEFRPVHVRIKEFEADAWIWLPGDPDARPSAHTPAPASTEGASTVLTANHGVIISGGAVSGPIAVGNQATATVHMRPQGQP